MDSSLIQGWIDQQDNLLNYGNEPEPEDLIEGVLPSSSIILLTGEPKSGKSLIVQSWVHAITTGSDWFGRKATPGIVFYAYPDGESPRKLRARFMAIEQATGVQIDHRNALPFAREFNIQNESHKENILSALDYEGVSLIVIDTLAASAGQLNLSNQTDIYPFSEFAKQVLDRSQGRTSVLFIMHSPKANPKDISGSTQIKAFGSVIFAMTKRHDSLKGDRYQITCTDNRNGPSGWNETFGVLEVDLQEFGSSVVLVEADRIDYRTTALTIDARKLFEGIPSGEYVPQATLVKTLVSRGVVKSTSSAYEWLNKATEGQILGATGERKTKAFCFPYSENSQQENNRNAQIIFRDLPESLDSGIRKRAELENSKSGEDDLF
jgi:hypothetical protein